MEQENVRSALDVLHDRLTPQWIKDGFSRIKQSNPSYAALLIAIHDIRVGASKPNSLKEERHG